MKPIEAILGQKGEPEAYDFMGEVMANLVSEAVKAIRLEFRRIAVTGNGYVREPDHVFVYTDDQGESGE